MKKILLSLATIFALCTPVVAQVQQNGNVFSAPTTEQRDRARADSIGAYWEDADGRYPIYMGRKGGLFYFKNDKKKYIPKAQAQAIKEAIGIKQEDDK